TTYPQGDCGSILVVRASPGRKQNPLISSEPAIGEMKRIPQEEGQLRASCGKLAISAGSGLICGAVGHRGIGDCGRDVRASCRRVGRTTTTGPADQPWLDSVRCS